jgi:glycine reductase complex component B subunit gamma
MSPALRAVHYVNQFFAGIGGEEHAHVGVSVRDGALGPGRALQTALADTATVVATLIAGDNFVSERSEEALEAISAQLRRLTPSVVVAGPAFGSGRYGLACSRVCLAATALGIPAVTAMHPDNPGVVSFRKRVVIVPTGESSTSMTPALQHVARLAVKLGRGEPLGPAETEGYLPQGNRRVWDRGRPGYQRALDMLLAKLHDRPFVTEVPYNEPEKVAPAAPVSPLERATIAMVTTGGLVRKGNPDRQVAANATRFHRHSVRDLESLTPEGWEAYHAGYFNHIVNRNRARARVDVRAARREHAVGQRHRARTEHRARPPGGQRRRVPPRRHLRDLQSLRRNDRQGNRTARHPGRNDLGHLRVRPHHRRQPGGARCAHRARVR